MSRRVGSGLWKGRCRRVGKRRLRPSRLGDAGRTGSGQTSARGEQRARKGVYMVVASGLTERGHLIL